MPFFFNFSLPSCSVLPLCPGSSNLSGHSSFVPIADFSFSVTSSNVDVVWLLCSLSCLLLSLMNIFSQSDLISSILVILLTKISLLHCKSVHIKFIGSPYLSPPDLLLFFHWHAVRLSKPGYQPSILLLPTPNSLCAASGKALPILYSFSFLKSSHFPLIIQFH